MPRVTEAVTVDKDFSLDIDICKAITKEGGQRVLTGVASGVLEDADGERVSRNGIVKMARQAVRGLKLVAGSHAQDWHNEIGDVSKVEHDPKHDELLVEVVLPPEGEDPLADKAWKRQTVHGEQLGFSIGGKLRKAFFELTDDGRKRRVLDDIALQHVALTKKPSYRQSFAVAVAKTRTDDGYVKDEYELPGEDAFKIEWEDEPAGPMVVERVAKADDGEPEVAKADSTIAAADQDTQGYRGAKGADTEAPDVSGDDAKKDPPQGGGARHLACPNCGHEFAAGMPAEQDAPAEVAGDDADNDREARKTAPESEDTMPLDKTLENLRKLAGTTDDAQVEKTDDTETTAKTESGDPTAVEKLVAASHEANQTSIATLTEGVQEAFGEVAKAIKQTNELIASLPGGRQSIARLKGGAAAAVRDEDGGEVAKTDDDAPLSERVAKVFDGRDHEVDPTGEAAGIDALKLLNREQFGIQA